MFIQEAIGKIILSGEHAVVYGSPALALPVKNCKAKTKVIFDQENPENIIIKADQLNKKFLITKNEKKAYYDPLEQTLLNFFDYYSVFPEQGFTLEISSDIPVASGMGSGAAIAVSMIKTLADIYKKSISNEELFTLVMKIEEIYHGNPSGIDPKVIIYEKPVYFIKNEIMEVLEFNFEYTIAIIDSGIKSSTKKVVEWVAEQKNNFPAKLENIFDNIANITKKLKEALVKGNINDIGYLMNQNHIYLQEMGVSNQILDELVNISLKAGAKGSKLSGAGWGGIVIALIEKDQTQQFNTSLNSMGVRDIIFTDFV